jgi:hypothetical protein
VQVPGQKTPATAAPTAGGKTHNWRRWWWLGVGILATLLIAVAVLEFLRGRERRAARADTRDTRVAERDHADEVGYDAESESQWPSEADDDHATSSLSEVYRAPVRPRTVRLPSQQPASWTPAAHDDLDEETLVDEIVTATELSDVDEDFDRHLVQELDEDPDAVDTAPTRIPSGSELGGEAGGGRHAAADTEDDTAHFAATPIASGQLAIHLPMDDPYQVPDGYPVKANASFGLYYMPDSTLYEDTMAELWFANEEIARANGFNKAG